MMSHAWPIVVRGGLLSPRGYSPLYALMILQPPRPALRRAVPAPRRARRSTSRCSATARSTSRRSRSRPRCSLAARAAGPRARAAAGRALLRADHRVDRRWACSTGCATARRPAGRRRRARGDAPGDRRRGRRGRAGRHRAAHRSRAMLAIRLESPRPPDLPPAPRRQGRQAVRHAQAAHDGQRRRDAWARAWRSTRATRGSRASGRSCAAGRSTSCPTSSTCCAARCRSIGPRPTIQVQVAQYTDAPARAPGRSSPGLTGWAQVNGRAVAALERAHRARPLVRRAPQAARSTCGSSGRRSRMLLTGDGLYKGDDRRLARPA